MKIKKLELIDFRHIKNQTIYFGDKLTAISGQNSTWKTSLLGWIAQACKYKWHNKTITGNPFQEKYSEIFRFCPEKDFSKTYEVILFYEENGKDLNKWMKTRYLKETEKGPERYRIDYDGRGNPLNFPIIYLGLKRLIPLATEKVISLNEIKLNKSETNFYSKISKEILILLDTNIFAEGIKSTNKSNLAMKTNNYGHLGNSAGQDNIGQIISSLISFMRLKKEQKDNYKGWLLLIDEIDATLYAGSQIKLIESLFKFARECEIQIIFTTHSIEILDFVSWKTWEDSKINFLELKDGTIKNSINPAIDSIKNKIKVQIGKKENIAKKNFLCEDKVTELWFKNLLNGSSYKSKINVSHWPFPEGTLVEMANSKTTIFKDIFFVLDWDCRKKYQKLPQRTIILPGNFRPESIFFDFLKNLSDNDEFWNEERNFTKQTCFQNYQTEKHDKGVIKRRFQDKEFSDFFWKGYVKLFNRWKKDNYNEIKKIHDQLEKALKL